jgi:formylglycine-generating enzyme required for sulfatase activity
MGTNCEEGCRPPHTEAHRSAGALRRCLIGIGAGLLAFGAWFLVIRMRPRFELAVPRSAIWPPRPGKWAGQETINPHDGAVLVWVPAGVFTIGTPATEARRLEPRGFNEMKGMFANEAPQHKAYLDGFWIYKTEVTVEQFLAFCKATGRHRLSRPRWARWRLPGDLPVTGVTWADANEYARAAGAKLPTEAQWEKAARGTDGRRYPWGNQWDPTRCGCPDYGQNRPWPVGSFASGASPYGCLDMAGNANELCADWYDDAYYSRSRRRNPTGPARSTGNGRVIRGGDWLTSDKTTLRSTTRFSDAVGELETYGFRCAVEPAR